MRPGLVAYLNQCGWGAPQKRCKRFIGKVEIRYRNQHFLIFQNMNERCRICIRSVRTYRANRANGIRFGIMLFVGMMQTFQSTTMVVSHRRKQSCYCKQQKSNRYVISKSAQCINSYYAVRI